jgi:7-carboxy-7-deazaguanine synthase
MSPTASDPITLQVCELFRSIAGETTWAGLPATFVRLSGCNLRCSWCDTKKAWEPGRDMPLERVLELLGQDDAGLVVVTGGEPLMQAGTVELCRRLLDRGWEVLLETNGSIDVSGVPEGVRIILDVKTPSSGEHQKMDLGNLVRLKPGDDQGGFRVERFPASRAQPSGKREYFVLGGVGSFEAGKAGRLDP